MIAAVAGLLASASLVFGHSVDGRPLVADELGDRDAARTMLVVGSIHGDETEGHQRAGRGPLPSPLLFVP